MFESVGNIQSQDKIISGSINIQIQCYIRKRHSESHVDYLSDLSLSYQYVSRSLFCLK
jgi:hypothetical protein